MPTTTWWVPCRISLHGTYGDRTQAEGGRGKRRGAPFPGRGSGGWSVERPHSPPAPGPPCARREGTLSPSRGTSQGKLFTLLSTQPAPPARWRGRQGSGSRHLVNSRDAGPLVEIHAEMFAHRCAVRGGARPASCRSSSGFMRGAHEARGRLGSRGTRVLGLRRCSAVRGVRRGCGRPSKHPRRDRRTPRSTGGGALPAGQRPIEVEFGPTVLHDLRSVSKSIVSLLVGIARQQGKIGELTTPVLAFYPEYTTSVPPSATPLHWNICSR